MPVATNAHGPRLPAEHKQIPLVEQCLRKVTVGRPSLQGDVADQSSHMVSARCLFSELVIFLALGFLSQISTAL